MQRTAFLVTVLAFLTLVPVGARAAESTPAPSTGDTTPAPAATSSGGGGWLLGGSTVGAGQNYFLGEFGWPGLNLSLIHGMSEKFDLGGTFSFVYGFEGVPRIAPGIKLNAILKLNLVKQAKFSLGLRLNPGFTVYFPTSAEVRTRLFYKPDKKTMFGIQFPLELLVGIPVISSLAINIGVSLPMILFIVPEVSFVMPIQPGFGLEYKVDNSLSLTLDTRYGVSIFIVDKPSSVLSTPTEFSFRAQFGLSYRF
ncbi:MAG: hypothetical protein QM765_50570 [Myxococcales bacterium]